MTLFLLILAAVATFLTLLVSVAGKDFVAVSGTRAIGLIAVTAILAAAAIQITEILS